MSHERGQKNYPSKQNYLSVSYTSELAFEVQDDGFSVQHPVKLASDDNEHVANISSMPTLSLDRLAALK